MPVLRPVYALQGARCGGLGPFGAQDAPRPATTPWRALIYSDSISRKMQTRLPMPTGTRKKALIAGLILHTVVHEPLERRTLATLRINLTLTPARFADLLTAM